MKTIPKHLTKKERLASEADYWESIHNIAAEKGDVALMSKAHDKLSDLPGKKQRRVTVFRHGRMFMF